jgi:hypothetical protein
MGLLNSHGGGGSNGGTDWVGNALNLAGGSPAPTPATPAAPGGNIPHGFWGNMIYRIAQARHAAGQPTPLGDHMGWFGAPQTPAAQPPVPASNAPQSSLASLLGMPAAY